MHGPQTVLSLLLAGAVATLPGCTTGERAHQEETEGTAIEAGRSAYDDSALNNFLPEYIREHSMFGDNDLRYEVKDGRRRCQRYGEQPR